MFYNSGEFDADNPSILFQDEGKTQLKKQFRNYINDFNEDDFFLVGDNEYTQGENKPLKAAKFLLNKKQGIVKNAFKNTPYGDVGISYGDSEHSLYHIIDKHILELDDFDSLTEVINTIDDVLRSGTEKEQINNNKVIIKGDYKVVLGKNPNGNIIITGYDFSRSEKKKERTSSVTLFDRNTFKRDGTLVLSEVYIKDNIKNIDLSSIRFQTQHELIDDAKSFERWQNFMEYYETFGSCITSRKRDVVLLKLGFYPTLLSESLNLAPGRKIDMLLNLDILVEIKSLTGNAQTIAKEIKNAINKENSEIIRIFFVR